MVRLNSKDSAILLDAVEQPYLTKPEIQSILSEASADAQTIGNILMGYVSIDQASVDVRNAVADIRQWFSVVAACERR